MNKKYLLIILAVVILLIVGLFLWLNRSSTTRPPVNGSNNIPDYTLTEVQQRHFQVLVQTLVEGYNTYSYYNYTALLDVQGNSTPALASKIQKIIDRLQTDASLKNYEIIAVADPATFTYRYPAADTILADMEATITEQTASTTRYRVKAHLTLKQQPDNIWLLDEINLEKIN